jgi:hypothetical protein
MSKYKKNYDPLNILHEEPKSFEDLKVKDSKIEGIKVTRIDFSSNILIPTQQDIQNIIGSIIFDDNHHMNDTMQAQNIQKKISDFKTDSLDQMEAVMQIDKVLNEKYSHFTLEIEPGGIDGSMSVDNITNIIYQKYLKFSI